MSAYFNAVVYNAVYSACLLNAAYSACLLNAVAALSNAVCLHIAFSLPMIFANAFCFHALSWFINIVCLFQILSCIIHSAFNMLALFFFIERAM